MLIDSHCHLDMIDLTPFENGLQDVIDAAKALSVEHFLCVSCDPERNEALAAIAAAFPQVSYSVGLHPTEKEKEPIALKTLLDQGVAEGVVAIGETGLDYFHCKGDMSWQHARFECHIEAAKQLGLPLIVHTRDAKEDTLHFLKQAQREGVHGVLHCFTEDWAMAKTAIDNGFMISFSGIVTFKNAAVIQSVAQKVPDDAYLVETDAPFLAPVPYRGKPNLPGYVHYVAQYVATLRETSFEAVAATTTANFQRLFSKAKVASST